MVPNLLPSPIDNWTQSAFINCAPSICPLSWMNVPIGATMNSVNSKRAIFMNNFLQSDSFLIYQKLSFPSLLLHRSLPLHVHYHRYLVPIQYVQHLSFAEIFDC